MRGGKSIPCSMSFLWFKPSLNGDDISLQLQTALLCFFPCWLRHFITWEKSLSEESKLWFTQWTCGFECLLVNKGNIFLLTCTSRANQRLISWLIGWQEKEAYVKQLAVANSELEELRETISTLESTVLALRSQVKSLQSEKDELSGENQSLLDQVNSYKVG